MKASELITDIQKVIDRHGDRDIIVVYDGDHAPIVGLEWETHYYSELEHLPWEERFKEIYQIAYYRSDELISDSDPPKPF